MILPPAFTLGALLGDLAGDLPPEAGRLEVTGLAVDSRAVRPGDLFFCCRGEKVDGHEFAGAAAAAGARALVVERPVRAPAGVAIARVASARRALARAADRFHDSPSRSLAMVGVTGTNGKTTVSFLVHSVLGAAGFRAGLVGTVEYRWAGTRRAAAATTPDPLVLQPLLREMREAGCDAAVMEVSSHGLAMERAAEVDFDVVVFTNLTHDHLDFHGDFAAYRAAKARLFARDEPYGDRRRAVFNADDETGRAFAANATLPALRYGSGEDAELRVEVSAHSADGLELRLRHGGGAFQVSLPLVGRHNAMNAAAAAAAAILLGIEPATIARGLSAVPAVPGRLEAIRLGQPFGVYVDYAHTPDALERALAAVRETARGPLTVVFGCGGDRDRAKRPVMGAIACRDADRVIVTNDNPRGEDPREIAAAILGGCQGAPAAPEVELDRGAAIALAVRTCPPGGAVLVAGKGHEDYQLLGSERRPFDDREAARGALRDLGFGERPA